MNKPIVFLDSARFDKGNRYSYLFIKPVKVLKTDQFSQVPDLLKQLDDFKKRYFLAGYIAYEAAYMLEEKFLKSSFSQLK